jgi:protein SCO1/2
MRGYPILCGLLLGLFVPAAAFASDYETFDEQEALEYSQSAIGTKLSDHQFTASDGTTVGLAGYAGRPLVISLIYTSCYHTCPMITARLLRGIDAATETFGADAFSVVTIGFDVENDTPQRMGHFATSHGIDFDNWQALSTDKATIDALSAELGFIFFSSPKGFDHLAQTSIIDAEGKLYRHVYGASFKPPAIMEPLKTLIFGGAASSYSLEGLVNRVKLFCTIYDPKSDRYRFDYSLFVAMIIGALCLSGVAIVLVREWRRTSRHRKP